MEHHDFPYIPGSKLPEVKRIAGEFYDNLPQHSSWLSVLYVYLFHPRMGPYARVKREYEDLHGSRKVGNRYLNADNTMKPVFPGDPVVPIPSMKASAETNGLVSNGIVGNGHVGNGVVSNGHLKDE